VPGRRWGGGAPPELPPLQIRCRQSSTAAAPRAAAAAPHAAAAADARLLTTAGQTLLAEAGGVGRRPTHPCPARGRRHRKERGEYGRQRGGWAPGGADKVGGEGEKKKGRGRRESDRWVP
jgi:hypothetical protein